MSEWLDNFPRKACGSLCNELCDGSLMPEIWAGGAESSSHLMPQPLAARENYWRSIFKVQYLGCDEGWNSVTFFLHGYLFICLLFLCIIYLFVTVIIYLQL